MSKYDEAVAEAQAFTEKWRDVELPIVVLVGKLKEDTEDFAIEKVAIITQFNEVAQTALLTVARFGETNDVPKGQN